MSLPHTIFPHENAFYNSAFQIGFVTSTGEHGPNYFLPFVTSDGQVLPSNSSSFNGFAHPAYYVSNPDFYSRIIGKHKFVKKDNLTGFAKFYPDNGEVAIGEVDGLIDPDGLLEVARTGGESQITVSSTISGDSVLKLAVNGNHAYRIVGNRASNKFEMLRVGSPAFLEFFPASGDLALTGVNVKIQSGSTPVLQLTIPSEGGLQWSSATEPTCDVARRGTVNYVAGGASVADSFRICRKSGADAFAWVDLY